MTPRLDFLKLILLFKHYWRVVEDEDISDEAIYSSDN